jgi:hypothetical protein
MSAPVSPITTTLIWNEIKITVIHTPNCHGEIDHVELYVENQHLIPVTPKGYKS